MCALLVLQQLAILLRPSVLQTPVPRHRAAAFLASGEPAANGATMLSNAETSAMLSELQLTADAPLSVPPRGVFCTRSLDLTKIKCIGYDMDYTLIDYKMEVWEARAYHYSKEELRAKGFPVSGLKFKPELVCRGLIIDTERGSPPRPDRRDTPARMGTRSLSVVRRQPPQGGSLRVRAPRDARHSHALACRDVRGVRALQHGAAIPRAPTVVERRACLSSHLPSPGGCRPSLRPLVLPQHALLRERGVRVPGLAGTKHTSTTNHGSAIGACTCS